MNSTIRKPKGWAHRWQLILRPTKHPSGATVNRWHKIKLYGKNEAGGTYGTLTPHPGDDIGDDKLILRAGLADATVPVEIIRPHSPDNSVNYSE